MPNIRSFTLNLDRLTQVLNGDEEVTTALGYTRDVDGKFYTIFVQTDKETKAILGSDDGERISFNIQPQKRRVANAGDMLQTASGHQRRVFANPAATAQRVQPSKVVAPEPEVEIDLDGLVLEE